MEWLDDDFFDPDDGKNKDIENYIESTLKKVDQECLNDKFEDSKTKKNAQDSDQLMSEISKGINLNQNEIKVQEIMNNKEESQMCWDESDLDLEFSGSQVLNYQEKTQKENTENSISDCKEDRDLDLTNFESNMDSEQEMCVDANISCSDDELKVQGETVIESSINECDEKMKDAQKVDVHNESKVQEVELSQNMDDDVKIKDAQNIDAHDKNDLKSSDENIKDAQKIDENELKVQETVEPSQNMDGSLIDISDVKIKDAQKIDENELKVQKAVEPSQNIDGSLKDVSDAKIKDAQKIDENELKVHKAVEPSQNIDGSLKDVSDKDAQKIDKNELKVQKAVESSQNIDEFLKDVSDVKIKDAQKIDENELKVQEDVESQNIDGSLKDVSDAKIKDATKIDGRKTVQKAVKKRKGKSGKGKKIRKLDSNLKQENEDETMDTSGLKISQDLNEKSEDTLDDSDLKIAEVTTCTEFNESIKKEETESDNEIKPRIYLKPGQSRSTSAGLILSCIKCNDIHFDSKSELFEHLKNHSKKVIYCDLNCQHAMNAVEHMSCHDNTPLFNLRNRRFFCWICGYRTKNSSNAVVHMRMHSGSKPFKCSICDFKDRTKSGVKRHEKTHSSSKDDKKTRKREEREGFRCDKCDFTCSRLNALHNHEAVHFNSEVVVKTIRKPKKTHKYSCTECPYQGLSSKLLRRHKMKHLFIKPYSCDTCTYSTVDAYSLKLHKRKHTGEKPHFCTICDYRCSRATTLKVHIRKHTGEKPYACIYCEYRSANNSGLKSHMMSHTGEKPYSCNFCDFKCSSSRSMKRHLNTHKTKEANLSCPICLFPGMTDTAFRKHMKTHDENKSTLVCPEFNCDFTTYNMNHLQKHLKSHENVGDFTCHICGLMCECAEDLNTHLTKVHLFQTEISLTRQKVTYSCDECNFRTTNQKEFQYHGLSHSNESQLISILNPEIKLEVVQ